MSLDQQVSVLLEASEWGTKSIIAVCLLEILCYCILNSFYCSRKRFSEKQAEQWWAANRARVYQQYNVPMGDRSIVSVGREGLAQ